MNNIMKKAGYKLLSLMLLAGLALVGCGKDAAETSGGGTAEGGMLTREAYAAMVGSTFGYDSYVSETALFDDVSADNEHYAEIQACAEWDVIPAGGNFEPAKDATLEFVIDTAVRAVGLEKINTSGMGVDETTTVEFYTSNIAQIDTSKLDAQVDYATAQEILDYAKSYRNGLVLPQVCELEMADGVITAENGVILNLDGATGQIEGDNPYQAGDIIYLPGTDAMPACAVKITAINGSSFEYVYASPEETFSSIKISGTYDGTIIDASTTADGVEVSYGNKLLMEEIAILPCSTAVMGPAAQEMQMMALAGPQRTLDKSSNHVVYKVSMDEEYEDENGLQANAHAEFNIGIKNIEVTLDYESILWDLRKADAKVRFDTEISGEVDGHISKSFTLGTVDVQIGGLPALVRVTLEANIGADGEISVTYTTRNVFDVGWKKGAGFHKDFESTPSLQIEAEVTLTAEATAVVDLRIGWNKASLSLVNAEVTTGMVAVAKFDVDVLSDEPACTDVLVYVPLRWGVNQRKCILTDISNKFKYSATIWDSESSKIQMHFHWEDGVRVEECTRGQGEEVITDNVDEEGNPYDEYDLFDFEPLEFGFIHLESNTMYIDPGASMKIGIVSVPEGYSESDLTYTSQDASICNVSADGTVSGVSGGSTIVVVKTSDGSYQVNLTVVVRYEYDGLEGFESL